MMWIMKTVLSRSVIVTSLGAEEEISCNVHAYPKPSVTWMKVGSLKIC